MATIPVPRSYNQIVGDMIDAFTSDFGLRAMKVGSPVLSMLESAAQSQLRSSEDIFTLLDASSLDQATGTALDRIGADESAGRNTQTPASGTVTVTDTSFAKISTKVFQGASAPIVGSVAINVQDATLFPVSGAIYLGRGTSNYEGPLTYTSILPPGAGAGFSGGNFYTLTLSSGTQRFHNLGESIVLAQGGNRNIGPGCIVQTPQGNVVVASTFATRFPVTIPDGETQIIGVDVTAQKPGVIGNVTAKGIVQFATPPFVGASVTNSLPFTNGISTEDDDTYRERIRQARQSRVKGTPLALQTVSVGVINAGENKRVLSASVVAQSGLATSLYIDDGTGYEEVTEGIAIESLSELAAGGEDFFKISAPRPVAKAHLTTSNSAPFVLNSGDKLAVAVGGVVTEHTFDLEDFNSIGNATAYEVTASVNANSTLGWSARTTGSGTQVVIFAKADTGEAIQYQIPSGGDANAGLGFPVGRVDTMRLYKNDRLLNKDGALAFIYSSPISNWNAISGDQTLVVAVDGILMSFGSVSGYSTAAQFSPITGQDFVNSLTGYTSLALNSVQAWAKVLSARIPGVTASVASGLIILTSNRGRKSSASVAIVAGSIVNNRMFVVQGSVGADSDYALDRNTGEFRLTSALLANDRLAAGSVNTRAFLETAQLGLINVPSTPARLWFSVDGSGTIVSTAVTASTAIAISYDRTAPLHAPVQPWGIRSRVISVAGQAIFSNMQTGDQAVFWDPAFPIQGSYPVSAVAANGTYFDIEIKGSSVGRASFTSTILADGRILLIGGTVGPNQVATASAEIVDPTLGTYTTVPTMSTARSGHRASLMASGRVLVTGGISNVGAYLATTEIYDPTANVWATGPVMSSARAFHGQLKLADGSIVVVGGQSQATTWTASCDKFDATASSVAATAPLATARGRFISVLLPSNNIIVAGGENFTSPLQSAELYNATASTWSSAGNMVGPARHSGASALVQTSKAYVTGGSTAASSVVDVPVAATDFYIEGTGWLAGPTLSVAAARHHIGFTADGNGLIVGGNSIVAAQRYTLSSNTWSAITPMLSEDGYSGGYRINNRVVSIGTKLYVFGGTQINTRMNFSVGEIWDGAVWSILSSALTVLAGVYPLNKGLDVARSSSRLQRVSIPVASSYTAGTITPLLASQLAGATPSVYRTTAYRLRTNTFNDQATGTTLAGDIALLSANVNGQKLGLTVASSITNITGHLASIESGNSDVGTPSFDDVLVIGNTSDDYSLEVLLKSPANTPSSEVNVYPGDMLVGLGKWGDGPAVDGDVTGFGHVKGFVSAIRSFASEANGQYLVGNRLAPEVGWLPYSRAYFATPYQIAASDQFTVLVDGNVDSKRFTLNMYRNLKTQGTTYGAANVFRDGDNANRTLAVGFGYTGAVQAPYDFNDHAVYMHARAKTDTADTARAILWRFNRLGPDGNASRIRYVYPVAAATPLSIITDNLTQNNTNDILIALGSGPARTGYVLSSSYPIGVVFPVATSGVTAAVLILGYKILSATRATGGVVTLVLEMPPGTISTGWSTGSGPFNFQSTSGSITSQTSFVLASAPVSSGLGAGTIIDTITYTDTVLTAAATVTNPGVVYLTANQTATLAGAGIIQNDLFRFEPRSTVNPRLKNVTLRIDSSPIVNPYYIVTNIEETGPSLTGVASYSVVGDSSAFSIFSQTSQTSAAIAAAALALATSNPAIPVTPTLISDGTGVINTSSVQLGGSGTWFYLTDGLNYVAQTQSPSSLTGDYTLTFKLGINTDLVTNADWANETVRIVPRTAANMVTWMSSPAISGLFTSTECSLSSRAHKVQLASLTTGSASSLQVQGGTSNSATAAVVGTAYSPGTTMTSTIKAADSQGFISGAWTTIDNTVSLPRAAYIFSSTVLNSLILYGNVAQYSLYSASLFSRRTPSTVGKGAMIRFERCGRFVRIDDVFQNGATGALDLSSVLEGDWVRLSTNGNSSVTYTIPNVNTGIYKVVRVVTSSFFANSGASGSIYIEAPNAVDMATCIADVDFFSPDSVMPSDVLAQSTALWGVNNRGKYAITSVGAQRFNIAPGQMTRTATLVTVDLGVGNLHNLAATDFITMGPGESFITTTNADGSPVQFQVLNIINNHSFSFFTAAGTAGPNIASQAVLGHMFQNQGLLEVDNTAAVLNSITAATPALGTDLPLIQILEGAPARYVKQILSISPNQAGAGYVDVKFTTGYGFGHISSAAGSVVTALDKLGFSTDIRKGIDGYQHSVGLIGEVNRVIYGDPNDPATYPGVAAAGATVNILGPLVKRIQIALSIRIRQGDRNDIADKVRSAVAAVVNAAGIGGSIALSDIIAAARSVTGVIAVAMVKPTLTAATDTISVQAYEKPRVLNLDQDITISFVGD